MEIKNLSLINLETIFEAFQKAFLNYFVPFTSTFEQAADRWEKASVDFTISYGAFSDGKLAAFILNSRTETGIYNFAMGVIPEFRGQHLIEKIIPHLPKDCDFYRLEVIVENTKAINLYKKLGYEIKRELVSFQGELNLYDNPIKGYQYDIKEYSQNDETVNLRLYLPSTESSFPILSKSKNFCETHELIVEGEIRAFAHFIPQTLSIKELGTEDFNFLDVLLKEMKLSGEKIRLMNVDTKAHELIEYLEKRGLKKFISQYEMEKTI